MSFKSLLLRIKIILVLILILPLYSNIYSISISFDFKLKVELEKNERLNVVVHGKNLIKDDILSSLYNIKVKFFVPYFQLYSEEYQFKDILKPNEEYVAQYRFSIPQLQNPGYYTIFGIFQMEDVNTYPLNNVTYTYLKYGEPEKKLLTTQLQPEIACESAPGNKDEEFCFEVANRQNLNINFSMPHPLSEYLIESGIGIITQPEFTVTEPIYRFNDSAKRRVTFSFKANNPLDDSKYIFYVFSYANYRGIADTYHTENITYKYVKKVPRKLLEWSANGFLLPISVGFLILFLVVNVLGWRLFADTRRSALPTQNDNKEGGKSPEFKVQGLRFKIQKWIDNVLLFIIFYIIYTYLFSLIPLTKEYFNPNTAYVAGDNATHYNLAKVLKEWGLKNFVINTWDNTHFAGYKIFQTYFPFPFILIALLSYLINFNIAFKIIHIIGTLLLPLAFFISGRFFRLKIAGSSLLSILSLLFLVISHKVIEGQTVFILWGGNLTSTLAGEFCFSLSFLFFVLYCGILYSALTSPNKKKYFIPLVVLEVIIGLSHAFTMLYILFTLILFFMSNKQMRENFIFIVLQQITSLLFMAWWLIPTLYYKNYTFSNWYEGWSKKMFLHNNVISLVLISGIIFILSMTFWKKFTNYINQHKILLITLAGLFIFGILMNYIAYPLGVADIRFYPLTIFAAIVLGGFFFNILAANFRHTLLLCISILCLALWIIKPEEKVIKVWIRFNSKGLNYLHYYEHYQNLVNQLQGDFGNGRIITDKSDIYNPFGSPLALTLLPHYNKRQVLDGMDYRSSCSSFFAFDLQTSISSSWGSYPDGFSFSAFDLKMAKKKARIFNIENFIIANPTNIKKFSEDEDFYLQGQSGPFNIFSLKNFKSHYVEALSKQPLLVATSDWKSFSHRWFKNYKLLDYPVVYINDIADLEIARKYFSGKIYIPSDEKVTIMKKLNLGPEEIIDYLQTSEADTTRYDINDLYIDEHISVDKIQINVTKTNIPLYVKIGYHPTLKIQGAERILFAAPSFMVIIPTQKNIVIYPGNNFIDTLSIGLFYIGLIVVIGFIIYYKSPAINNITIGAFWSTILTAITISCALILLLLPTYRLISKAEDIKDGAITANKLLNKATNLMNSTDKTSLYKAKETLEYIMNKYKKMGFLDEVLYKLAYVNFKLGNLSSTENTILQFFKQFPESIYYGHSLILWGKFYEKLGTDEANANAQIFYQIAKKEYPQTEIENQAINELKKYEKTTPMVPDTFKRKESLQNFIRKLDYLQRENLKLLLESKEFQKFLKTKDRKLIEDIIKKLIEDIIKKLGKSE